MTAALQGAARAVLTVVGGQAPVEVDRRQRTRAVVAAAVAGTLATTYLSLAGTGVGRNVFADDLWFFTVESITRTQLGGRPALVLLGLALVLLAGAWLLLGWAVRYGAGTRAVALLGALWATPLLIGIPLFSPDSYIYAAFGSSIQHGVDPFVDGPGAAGDVRGIRGAEQIWQENPAPYSPPFIRLLDLLARVFHEDVRALVVALRVLSVLAVIAVALLARRIAQLQGFDETRTLWLVVANPLFLLHAVSGAHNDVLMLVFLLAGVLLAMLRRPYLAVTLCALGGGVKIIALAVVAVIAVDAAWRMPTLRERVRVLLQIGGTGLALFAVAVTACGYGWAFVGNLDVPGLANEPLSPPTALATLLSPSDPPLDAVRAAALGVGALICLVLLTRVPEWGIVRPSAWILVTIVLTGSAVWPWYFMWPVLLLTLTGIRVDRWLAIAASLGSVFLVLPGGEGTLGYLGRPLADGVVVGGLAAAGAAALWARRRRDRSTVSPGAPA